MIHFFVSTNFDTFGRINLKMKKIVLVIFILQSIFSANAQLPLIPAPAAITISGDSFILDNSTCFFSNDKNSFETDYLIGQFKWRTGIDLKVKSKNSKDQKAIQFIIEKNSKPEKESYHLIVSKNAIKISAKNSEGIFYGIQTLLQLINFGQTNSIKIPCLQIVDEPRYSWRGMHLDVSRHFFPKEFIKKYIDCIAMYKMNVFHWHLTDDQGWRIEIKKYPKLTEIGAWRKGSMVGAYSDNKFDTVKYGGFYSQEDIREIVNYAKLKHVTIVPEIEMPGHSLAALSSYPEFSCSGKPVDVGVSWGVENNVYCPSEQTFQFLENVLTEVMALFPSKYIHIGGDEVPKEEWKKSDLCKEVMKRENLKDEHELQSYFIRRIEKFVNAKGRQIIGWDEILEGGLAPNAAVMSWRGIDGGIAAAKQKHNVVMTPGGYCYFDHYQGNPQNEPLAIGGYTTVEKTYSYEPTPDTLTVDEQKYILGAQGNVWTEYIQTPEHVEYMSMPRMTALSEVLWSKKVDRNYTNFVKRLTQHFTLLDSLHINYAKSIYELKTIVKSNENNGLKLEISTPFDQSGIRFTTDGSIPTINSQKYFSPIFITESKTIKAAYFENEMLKGNPIERKFNFSLSTGKKIDLKNPPSEYYKGDGAFTLVNGINGDQAKHGFNWLGWSGKDLDAVVDFEKKESFSEINFQAVNKPESWIYLPKQILVFISNDGINFSNVSTLSTDEILKSGGKINIHFQKQESRFVKIVSECSGKIAEGKPGAGENAWMFIDEISIR